MQTHGARRRRRPRLVSLVGLLLSLAVAPPVAGEEEDPFEDPIRALLFGPDDEALIRGVYDGIREGLEDAQLPRVRLERPVDGQTPDEVVARLEAKKPILLFVLGPETARRLGSRLADVPRVYVDTAWNVNGVAWPPDPSPESRPRTAVVRGVLNGSLVSGLLRGLDLREGRPRAALTWDAGASAKLRVLARQLAAAAGFERVPWDGASPPDVLLHLRLGAGERPRPLSEVVLRARADGIPFVSDDVAHWRRGAAVVIAPDHRLLGRVAAEAGRELLQRAEGPEEGGADDADPGRTIRRTVGAAERYVNLRAAKAEGLAVPLPFLAGADRLRNDAVRWPSEASVGGDD